MSLGKISCELFVEHLLVFELDLMFFVVLWLIGSLLDEGELGNEFIGGDCIEMVQIIEPD